MKYILLVILMIILLNSIEEVEGRGRSRRMSRGGSRKKVIVKTYIAPRYKMYDGRLVIIPGYGVYGVTP